MCWKAKDKRAKLLAKQQYMTWLKSRDSKVQLPEFKTQFGILILHDIGEVALFQSLLFLQLFNMLRRRLFFFFACKQYNAW